MITIDLENLPAEVEMLQELVRTLAEALHPKDTEIAQLKHRVALLCRHQFGSRSERVDPGQLELAIFAALKEAEASAPEPPAAPPAAVALLLRLLRRRQHHHGIPSNTPTTRANTSASKPEPPAPDAHSSTPPPPRPRPRRPP